MHKQYRHHRHPGYRVQLIEVQKKDAREGVRKVVSVYFTAHKV